MTERDLSTLLREHVRLDEPPLGASSDAAILAGRRALRRRRLRRGAGGILAAAAVAAITVPLLAGPGGPGRESRDHHLDPATRRALADYDPAAMPKILSTAIDPVVRRWSPGMMGGDFSAWTDQGRQLPKGSWRRASEMDLRYGLGEHTFRTLLLHARSEAEGDVREGCRSDLAEGYKFVCEVRTAPNGDTVTISVMAVRRLDFTAPGSEEWGAVTREELRTGKPAPGDPSSRPIKRDEIYFQRTVESVHSETFLTSAIERVKAPDLAHARAAFDFPVSALVSIVTNPTLVIPEPTR